MMGVLLFPLSPLWAPDVNVERGKGSRGENVRKRNKQNVLPMGKPTSICQESG